MILQNLNVRPETVTIISLALILFSGFLLTRVTKKLKLPNVTAYIVAGVLIGPSVLYIIPETMIEGMSFVTDIALAFIAFDVGKFLKVSVFMENKSKVLMLTLCESLIAAALVFLSMYYIFKLPLSFSILLGSIGAATAPASTIMTIRQYKAKGEFVNLILQVVALDDVVALIAFSISAAIVQAIESKVTLTLMLFLTPILLNVGTILMGLFFGFLLQKIITAKRTKDNKLILAIALILFMTGVCTALDISPLLSCMALGAAYANISNDNSLFKQLNYFTPPILMMFFVLSGMRLDLTSLMSGGIIGIAYFFIRIVGKYAGAYIGASLGGYPNNIKKYFGLALIPQAGVSIGLALLGQRMLPTELGNLLSTIILSSSVLYEMVGPAAAKASLHLSGSIPDKAEVKK